MMKKQLISLSVLAALSVSTAWAAAPTANLLIKGDIIPPTCTVNSGSNDLLYNFGTISPSVIPQDTPYNGLPSLSNKLTVTCDAETFLTFKATDNYPNTVTLPEGMNINYQTVAFNLVNNADTTKTIGAINFGIIDPTVDGKATYISRANDGYKDNGTWVGPREIVKDATQGWTKTQQQFVAPSALDLASGKVFSATIKNLIIRSEDSISYTHIYSKKMLADNNIDISEGLDYVGQVVLTFNFGI